MCKCASVLQIGSAKSGGEGKEVIRSGNAAITNISSSNLSIQSKSENPAVERPHKDALSSSPLQVLLCYHVPIDGVWGVPFSHHLIGLVAELLRWIVRECT